MLDLAGGKIWWPIDNGGRRRNDDASDFDGDGRRHRGSWLSSSTLATLAVLDLNRMMAWGLIDGGGGRRIDDASTDGSGGRRRRRTTTVAVFKDVQSWRR